MTTSIQHYPLSFTQIKKWLPQTANKIVYYLENLSKTQKKPDLFDINKTKIELCLKPKNNKGLEQLNRFKFTSIELEDFKKLLELSNMFEIYIKALFNNVIYRSKVINYMSYKNQHEYENKPKLKPQKIKDTLIKKSPVIVDLERLNIDMEIELKNKDVIYQKNNTEYVLFDVRCFVVENDNAVYLIGFHNEEDKVNKIPSLYKLDNNDTIKLMYFFDKNMASHINSIKDNKVHIINGKCIKVVAMENKKYNFT